jgi:hypothetical protein
MYKPSLFLASSLAIALSAAADPLIEKAEAASTEGPIYAYEMSYSIGDLTATGKADPSAPKGERLTVYTPEKDNWPEGFEEGLEEVDADIDGDIWCKDFIDMVPENALQVSETDTTATYAFTPKPDADSDGTEKKLMKKIKAEITLAKEDGAVMDFNMVLPKPYKPAMIVKINTFEMGASCARAPDGRTYAQDFNFEIDGSAMMQSFAEKTSYSITKLLDPVG